MPLPPPVMTTTRPCRSKRELLPAMLTPSVQSRHVARREVTERHRRAEREAGLIADAIFGVRRIVAGGIEAGDRRAALIDHPRTGIGDEPGRRESARMQLDAVERRNAQGAEAGIDIALVGARRLPLVFLGERPGGGAAGEIVVGALAGELIEPL